MVENGSFPVYSKDTSGDIEIGYDAAVCVQKYEPWVIETYNTSVASPSILRIVEKGNGNTSSPSGNIRGPPIENTRYLTTDALVTFDVAQANGEQQMQRANNADGAPYFPTTMVGSILPPRQTFF